MEKVTVKDVVKNEYVDQLIARGNEMLGVLGYTCLLYTSPSPRDCS